MSNTLVYLSYGQDRYQLETMYSILSARRLLRSDDPVRIVVYTDRPAIFAWLDVECRALTPALLENWMGKGSYPFRRKIACLATALRHDGGKVVLLDGDTYFRRNPVRLFDRIGPGRACLHLREIRLSRRKGTAGMIFGNLLADGAVREKDGRAVQLRKRESMWNSGVIGVDAADIASIERATHIVDEIWQREHRIHTLEQFALGHVLIERELSEADDVVFHYWWDGIRRGFIERLPAIIERARALPLPEAAAWSHVERPRPGWLFKAMSIVREIVHHVGLDHRWTRTSA